MNPFQTPDLIPSSYAEWRHCITVECGIHITAAFLEKRIEELSDEGNAQTKQFITLYGATYHIKVIKWFQQALAEKKAEQT